MTQKDKYYQKILDKHSNKQNAFSYRTPALNVISKFTGVMDDTFLSVTAFVTAPVLTSFVLWVLRDAQSRGINTLLFMARDGLVMYKIAKVFCKAWGIDIECKYFYASRYTLRSALYAIDKDYVLSLSDNNLNYNINESKVALESSEGYFLQEVPPSTDKFALVDTGWVGTTQESFVRLYNYFCQKNLLTFSTKDCITGYYFGMLASPPKGVGDFKCYYFSTRKNFYFSANFCVDLFESLCAANHGKVIAYKKSIDKWTPELADEEDSSIKSLNQAWNPTNQLDLCIYYAESFSKANLDNMVNGLLIDVRDLIKSFMEKPLYSEAKIYGEIPFSGKVVEEISDTVLAKPLNKEEIAHFSFTSRLIRRSKLKYKPVSWVQGSFKLSKISILKSLDIHFLMWLYALKTKYKRG